MLLIIHLLFFFISITIGEAVVDLLSDFKNILSESKKKEGEEDNDLLKMVKTVEETHLNRMDVSNLDRKCSVLIATAKVMTRSKLNITTFSLDLPRMVQNNPKDMLKPYMNAVQLDGYQKKKKRKAFCIGNTGKA